MALVLNGSGITSANIADGTITTDDILASDVSSLKSGRKNLIINGGFDVNQRGTFDTSSATATYCLDRFWSTRSTVTQKVISDGIINNAARIRGNSSGTPNFGTRLEVGSQILKSRVVTLSCRIRGSKAASIGFGWIRDYTGTTIVSETTLPITTSWVTYSKTFTISADANTYYNVYLANLAVFGGAVTDWIEVANVQLEFGSVATDFEHRSYGEELALCQRFYYEPTKAYRYSMNVGATSVGHYATYPHPVTMRTTPTITITTQYADNFASASVSGDNSEYAAGIAFTSSSVADLRALLEFKIKASAEL